MLTELKPNTTYRLIDKEGYFAETEGNKKFYNELFDGDCVTLDDVSYHGGGFSKDYCIIAPKEYKFFEEVSPSDDTQQYEHKYTHDPFMKVKRESLSEAPLSNPTQDEGGCKGSVIGTSQVASEGESGPIKSDGGSSTYYDIKLSQNIIDFIVENGYIKTEQLIEALGSDFDIGNILKCTVRVNSLMHGRGKEGNSVSYDCNKIQYSANRLKERKNLSRLSNKKNTPEREVLSLYKQAKRLCEVQGVDTKE